jgi:chemotaxis family two-component system response regulator Rcp1
MSEQSLKILIAEDNDADIFLIREALETSGLRGEVEVASTGDEALAAVDRASSGTRRLDLILLDLNLTTHSGLEVLRRVRDVPSLKDVRVVILTSSESPRDRESARRLKADLYLRKPMDLEAFLKLGEQVAALVNAGSSAGS